MRYSQRALTGGFGNGALLVTVFFASPSERHTAASDYAPVLALPSRWTTNSRKALPPSPSPDAAAGTPRFSCPRSPDIGEMLFQLALPRVSALRHFHRAGCPSPEPWPNGPRPAARFPGAGGRSRRFRRLPGAGGSWDSAVVRASVTACGEDSRRVGFDIMLRTRVGGGKTLRLCVLGRRDALQSDGGAPPGSFIIYPFSLPCTLSTVKSIRTGALWGGTYRQLETAGLKL